MTILKPTDKIANLIQEIDMNCKRLPIPNNKIDTINQQIKTIHLSSEPEEIKLNKMIQSIEDAYNNELQHFSKPFLGFGKPKTSEEFITRLNQNDKNYHDARILGLMLQKIYLENKNIEQKAKGSIYAIKTPDHALYQQLFPMRDDIIETNEYQSIYQSLKNINPRFTERDIYNLYENQNILDVATAKRLWPELTDKLLLPDDEIKNFLQQGLTPQLIETIIEYKIFSKHSVLAEALPSVEEITKKEEENKEYAKEATDTLGQISSQLLKIEQCREQLLNLRLTSASSSKKSPLTIL